MIDENERNINTLLFENDQLHLETNKKIFAIVHDLFCAKPTACKSVKVCQNVFLRYKRRSTRFYPLPLSVSLRSVMMTTSLDHPVSYLLFQPPPPPPVLLLFRFCFVLVCLFVCFLLSFWFLVCFVASDVLTTICHLAIVNVCMSIILSIGNTQISILLLCFLYLFVELMITMNE